MRALAGNDAAYFQRGPVRSRTDPSCRTRFDPTPNPLTLRVGAELYGEDQRGQAFVYPIAGSFVQFLLETRGIERFRSLYAQTPLLPLALNAGSLDRWLTSTACTLADLENEWKSTIVSEFSVANCETFAET